MFCGKCGAQNSDDASVCKECGAALNNAPKAKTDDSAAKVKPLPGSNYNKIGICAAIAAAVVVFIIFISLISGRGYKSTVNQFFDAFYSANGKKIVSLLPKKYVKRICESGDISKKEFIKELTEELEDQMHSIKQYNDIDPKKAKSEVLEAEKLTGSDLERIKDRYKESYDIKVKAAKEVTVKVKLGDISEETYLTVVKIGGSWYIDYSEV